MAVRVFSNNLPDPAVRAAVEKAVLETIGTPDGEWRVQIHENQDSPSWYVTLWGPTNFQWTREFFGLEEQNPQDDYAFIRHTIAKIFLPPPPAISVRRLVLKDFRCFDHLDLTLDRPSRLDGRWTCIAGVNGAGKSTILQALGLALLGNPLAADLRSGVLDRMRRLADPINRYRARIEVELQAGENVHPLWLEIDDGRITSSVPNSWDLLRKVVVTGYGATRSLVVGADNGNEALNSDVRRMITLFDPYSRLAGAGVLLARGPVSKLVLPLLENLLPRVFGPDLRIETSWLGIRFTVAGKEIVEAIDLPDGFKAAAGLLADLCYHWCEKAPGQAATSDPADVQAIVLIDEIDLHLHPALQRVLIPRLRAALPKVQWIVTTHSPLVLANFDSNEIVALDRDAEGSVRRLDRQILGFDSNQIYQWLMETEPTGQAIEQVLEKNEARGEPDDDEVAELLEESPRVNEKEARQRVHRLKGVIERLKP